MSSGTLAGGVRIARMAACVFLTGAGICDVGGGMGRVEGWIVSMEGQICTAAGRNSCLRRDVSMARWDALELGAHIFMSKVARD